MKIIIPFKFDSTRCRYKNIRDFYKGKSLLDITIENFKKYGHDIYLICENNDKVSEIRNRYSINHLSLSNISNDWNSVMHDLSKILNLTFNSNELICLWQTVVPLFFLYNNIQDFIHFAENTFYNKVTHDEAGQIQSTQKDVESVVPAYLFKDYLVDEKMQGVNFGPGTWHIPSQQLPNLYYITPMSVTTPAIYAKYNYSYSPKSIIWKAKGPYIDIDTEEEFQMAQTLWKFYSND